MSEKNFLEKIPKLTKDQINEQLIPHDSLWLIQVDLETHGPYHVEQLRKISDYHADELASCMACNLKQKNWKPFFEHGPFQKRTSEAPRPVIKAEEKGRHSYHILIDGQKKGPLSVSKINDAIDNGEVKMNNLISADGGKSWRKIYHFPQFDRRKEAGLDLEIKTPDADHFEKSRVYSTQVLKKLNLKKDEESLEKALLACQDHLKNKKESKKKSFGDISSTNVSGRIDDVFAKFSFNKKSRKNLIVAALVILIVGLFLFDGDKKQVTQEKSSKSRTIKKQKSRETASRARKAKPRKRSKYSSRDRTRRREDNLDNADLEYDENSQKYRNRNVERERTDEPPPRERKRRRADVEDEFVDNPDEEEVALDADDNEDMFDSGRQIALDEEIDEEYLPPEESSFDEGIEDLDY